MYKSAEIVSEIALKNGLGEGIILDTIYFEASLIAAKQKKYDEAISYLDLIKSPIANSQYNKGVFSLYNKNYKQTIEFLDEKNDQNSLWALALAYFFEKNYEEAFKKLEESIDVKSNSEVILTKAKFLSETGKKEEAVKLLYKLTKIKETKDRAENYLVSLLISIDKFSEAKKILPNPSKQPNYDNKVCWGYIYLKENKFDSSYQFFKSAFILNKNGTEAINGLGYSCLYQNNLEEAEKWFKVALEISNNNISAFEGLGFVFYENGNYGTSLQYFNSAISVSGLKEISYNGLLCTGYINYYFNQKESAKKILAEAISKSENNAWSRVYLGYCYYDEGDYELALSCFNKAYDLSPSNDILKCIGITETRLNMSDKAIKHLNEVLSEDSLNVFALNSLAFSYSEKSMHEEAILTMSKVRNLAPDNREYLINSGMIETNFASFFIDKSLNDSAKYHLSRMNEFYTMASFFGYDNSVLNINRGYGYCMTADYDSALVFYNNVNNAHLEASKINNIAVTNALKGDLLLAKSQFKAAVEHLEEEFDEKNDNLKKSVKNNIKITESDQSLKDRKKKYNSSIYYYINIEMQKPYFKDQYNFDYLEIKHKMPEETYTDLIYYDNILCDCVYETKIIVIEKPKPPGSKKQCPFKKH
jgi:tetratricopeptide (TPR) repeat protein